MALGSCVASHENPDCRFGRWISNPEVVADMPIRLEAEIPPIADLCKRTPYTERLTASRATGWLSYTPERVCHCSEVQVDAKSFTARPTKKMVSLSLLLPRKQSQIQGRKGKKGRREGKKKE